MHCDHDLFIKAVKDRRKLILTYFSGKSYMYITRLCVPVSYSSPDTAEDSEYYYVWDPESDVGERIIALPPSQIEHMGLSDETFDPNEFIVPEQGQSLG